MNLSFRRKIIYAVAIVALLVPLYALGQPEVKSESADKSSPGGTLQQMRQEYGLAQSQLGKIDPASETMRMATLGLRGIAAQLLWHKAQQYKRVESWDKLSATLNQLSKLQPNYISVWEFQAHNLSYNVSTEFDNYKHRYHWVKRGILFLMEGTEFNQRNPRLFWNLGWFCCQKLGRADEYRQFRRLFRDDQDFHDAMSNDISLTNARGPDNKPDNWLVGHEWYLKANSVVETGVPMTWLRVNQEEEGITDKRRSSLIFYSDAPMSRVNYANQIQQEVTPGEVTRRAWRTAAQELQELGNRDLPTSFGFTIRLNELVVKYREIESLRTQLEDLLPGVRAEMFQERLDALTPEQRAAYDKSRDLDAQLDADEVALVEQAIGKLLVVDSELIERAPKEKERAVRRIVNSVDEAKENYNLIDSYRNMVNYGYWTTRCEVEQETETADARREMMAGQKALEAGDPDLAKTRFDASWELWYQTFKKYPQLIEDMISDELEEPLVEYQETLNQLGEEFPPEGFALSPERMSRLLNAYLTEQGVDRVEQPLTPKEDPSPEDAADDQETREAGNPEAKSPDDRSQNAKPPSPENVDKPATAKPANPESANPPAGKGNEPPPAQR